MRYVLWDWNGTLLDDTRAALGALNAMLRRRGRPEISLDFYRANFAFPVRPFYRQIGMDVPDGEWGELAREYHAAYAAEPKALNVQALAALERVKVTGARQAIISALRQDLLDEATKALGVAPYMDCVYGVDNLDGESKLKRARELVGLIGGSECVLIGDALHDKEVADLVGIGCVLCAQGGHARERLARVAPTAETLLEAVEIALAALAD